MMKVIVGLPSSGKTKYCYDQFINRSKEDHKNYIYIVPEQFTLQTQKEIIERHPKKGILNIEVLSFQRLAHRVFEEVGKPQQKLLDETGKSMVLRKVVGEMKNQLSFFTKSTDQFGFIDEMKVMITEFYQYDIDVNALQHAQEIMKDNLLLCNKLSDITNIYENFMKYIESKYITTEEVLDHLLKFIHQSNILKDAIVCFDGFYGFTPQQYKIISALTNIAQDVWFNITMDSACLKQETMDASEIFFESHKMYKKLVAIATNQNNKIEKPQIIERIVGEEEDARKGILHLAENLFKVPYKVEEQTNEFVDMFVAHNRRTEIEAVSRQITDFIQNKGYKYSDMAVVVGNLQEYDEVIKRMFRMYDIPYFMDQKKDILGHPVIEFIRAGLEIFTRNWSYESVFRYLKTDLSGLPIAAVDALENFALGMGIKYKRDWVEKDWQEIFFKRKSMTDYESKSMAAIIEWKDILVDSLSLFEKDLSSKPMTVATRAKAIYNHMKRLGIYEKIEDQKKSFRENGQLLLEKEYDQVYKLFIELLDKMVEILGEEEMSLKAFSKLLDAGIEQIEVGLVPPSLEQVMIVDMERSRLQGIKVMFVIGFNDGVIPKRVEDGGILNQEDRQIIKGSLELAPDGLKKSFEEQFLIYDTLCKPTDYLWISYALADEEGNAKRPSMLINRMHKIFPNLNVIRENDLEEDSKFIQGKKSAFYYLVPKLRDFSNGKELGGIWTESLKWFGKDPYWGQQLDKIIEGIYYNNQADKLSHQVTNKLYGDKLIGSVSKLEQYAICPFSYFVRYGLKAKERKIHEIKPLDVGMFFHLAIERFSTKLEKQGLKWGDLDDVKRKNIIETTVSEIEPLFNHSIFSSSHRNLFLAKRLTNITNRAVKTLQSHIEKGEFQPKDFELAFGEGQKLPAVQIDLAEGKALELTGKIDRIDLLEEEGYDYVKIIDYKSGKQKFDIVALFHGLQMQLIVYLDAILDIGEKYYGKKLVPAGIFYFNIDDPFIASTQLLTEEQVEEEILKKFKLSGLVLAEEEIVKKMDQTIKGYSDVLPVRMTQKGLSEKQSSVATRSMFTDLQHYIREKMGEFGNEILKGDVKIYPYKLENEKGCDYCKYAGICQFDTQFENNQYNQLNKISKDAFWECIQQKNNKK